MPLGTKVKVHVSIISVHTYWKINKQICVWLSCRIISLNPKHELANNSTLPSLSPSIYLWAVGSPLSPSAHSLSLSHNSQKSQNVDFSLHKPFLYFSGTGRSVSLLTSCIPWPLSSQLRPHSSSLTVTRCRRSLTSSQTRTSESGSSFKSIIPVMNSIILNPHKHSPTYLSLPPFSKWEN